MHDVEAWRKSIDQQEKQLRSAKKETYDAWFKVSDLHSKKELAISKAVQEARTLNVDISEPLAAMQSTQKQLRTSARSDRETDRGFQRSSQPLEDHLSGSITSQEAA